MMLALAVVLLIIPQTILCFACSNIVSTTSPLSSSLHATTATTDGLIYSSTASKARIKMPNPNILQRITFGWVKSMMELGNKKPLEVEDLWMLPPHQRMESASQQYENLFQYELKNMHHNVSRNPLDDSSILRSYWSSPVTKALVTMYRNDFLLSGILKLANTFVQFLPSLIIARLLKYVDSHTKFVFPSMSNIHWKTFTSNQGFLLSTMLLVTLCLKTIIENQYFDAATTMGASIRGTMSSAVFRKSLRLSPSGRQNNTVGEIVNFSQLDTSRMEQVASSIHILWDGSLQVIGYTALLLHFLGPSVLAGIAAMIVIIPLNTYFLKKISNLKSRMLKFTDARVKLTNEILQGVRAIKSYNWEKAFVDQLNDIRAQELQAITAAANTKAVFTSLLNCAPAFVSALTLGVYATLGNTLDSTKVFTALALFNQLRFPLIFLPLLFNTLADGKVSLWRLTGFLLADEIEEYVENKSSASSTAAQIEGGSFAWTNSNSTAPTSVSARGQLQHVNVHIKKGELVAVVGPVGSGKSTLLSALLGELHKDAGQVQVNGRVAYVPQSSWIPNESIRNVILFGKTMDWRRYRNTILACGLSKDLKDLEGGDQTEIGEKGVNLSGGQKQRVSIARAVYDDADIYLFDDPLSALDTEVGMRVFRDCIKNLLNSKTRVLVTHQLSILPDVDRVIIMGNSKEGGCEIVDSGSFAELVARGHDLSKSFVEANKTVSSVVEVSESAHGQEMATSESEHYMLSAPTISEGVHHQSGHHEETLTLTGHHEEPLVREEAAVEIFSPTVGLIDLCHGSDCGILKSNEEFHPDEPVAKVVLSSKSVETMKPSVDALLLGVGTGDAVLAGGVEAVTRVKELAAHPVTPRSALPAVHEEPPLKPNTAPIRLMTVEDRGEGAVGFDVYKSYLRSAKNPLLVLAIIASLVLANATQLGQQWVIAAWTADAAYKKRPLYMYLTGVTFMASLVGVFNWCRTYISCILGALASKTIHRNLSVSVLQAPLSFFESTPIGRLVQRFSKDLDQIDQQLPSSFGQLVASTFQIVGAVVAISIITPVFSVYMIPVFGMYFLITNYYRNVARELKRLDSLTRSPIYTHFSETLGGLPVIRSFTRQNMYLRNNENKVDDNMSAYVSLKAVDRWLCIRLEMLGNLIVFSSALLAVIAGPRGGEAGISLNNSLSITSLLNWAVRNGADTESLMNSVERVLYTTNETPRERPAVANTIPSTAFHTPIAGNTEAPLPLSDSELQSAGWPWGGGITMEQTVMSYRDDFEPVLRGVSLTIQPGESIGIVGRTGSGKSSLLRALLRLTELREGRIQIDGVDISQIGLDTLRSSISIIPQDPVLFSGSIRRNLDPFASNSDEELWAALEKSNLAGTVRALPGGLSYSVSEGGENFSTGQRQLLCLTRALIRKSRVLLLDEATSSVDYETDAFIQRTIRQEFGNRHCTILTIAHRLDTIMDSDRIVVMDRGQVGECDTPAALLKNPNSLFSQLVAADRGMVAETEILYESLHDDIDVSPH